MRQSFLLRFWALLFGGEVVFLEDHQGEIYQTIARRTPFNTLVCPVFFFTKVGKCVLLEGGEVDRKSPSHYIRRWKAAKEVA